MGEWVKTQLGSFVKGVRGVSYSPSDLKDGKNSNTYFLLRSNNIQSNVLDLEDVQIVDKKCVKPSQALKKGDIVVCMSNGSKRLVGKNCIFNLDEPGFCVGAFCSSFSPNEVADENFVFQLFQSDQYQRFIDVSLAGSAINNLKNSTIEEFEFFVPKSKKEQFAISTILTTIDQSIEKTEQLIAKYERIKTGLVQDLLTRGIDEQGNIRSEETHEFKVSALGRIPKEWEIYNLNSICTDIVDCPHSTPEYLKGGTLVARTMHIKNGQYDIQNSSFVSEEEYYDRIHRLEPQPGDIIFTREAPVGEAFIIPQGIKICLGQRVMQLRTNLEYCIPEFLLELIYYQKTRLRFDAVVGGTTNPHLNVSDVRKFTFPFPEPQEQSRICKSLNEFRKLIQKENAALNKLKRIKTALMQDLLTGKVRVDSLTKSNFQI